MTGGINPGWGNSFPSYLANISGTLYFSANDGSNGKLNSGGLAAMGWRRWYCYGVVGGINPFLDSSHPMILTNVNGTLYFRASDASNGLELWRIGQTGFAEIVQRAGFIGGINPIDSSYPQLLTNVNGTLFFSANDGSHGTELWCIGISGLAEIVERAGLTGGVNPGQSGLIFVFSPMSMARSTSAHGGDDVGDELWRIGSSGLVEIVEREGMTGGIYPGLGGSNPFNLTNVNGTLYFTAYDTNYGFELWRIGTSEYAEIVERAGVAGGISPGGGSSVPSNLTNVNGTLYFRASDESTGDELWRIDNDGLAERIADINPGFSGSNPSNIVAVADSVYFTATNPTFGTELWGISDSMKSQVQSLALPGSANVFDTNSQVSFDDQDRMLVAYVARNAASTYLHVARYQPDGLIDASFGMDGTAIIDLSNLNSAADSVSLMDLQVAADGRAIVAASILNDSGISTSPSSVG